MTDRLLYMTDEQRREYAAAHLEDEVASLRSTLVSRITHLTRKLHSFLDAAKDENSDPVELCETLTHNALWGVANLNLDGLNKQAQEVTVLRILSTHNPR